jgi:YVTN family beta-propeller protein
MKKHLFKVLLSITFGALLVACDDKEKDDVTPVEETEYKFIRVVVNDETLKELLLVDPVKLTAEKFEAQFPKSALYGTQGGRFGAIVNGANNFVQLLDTGLEGHGDHVDVKGTPKFGALTGDGNKPTHFKSKGDEIIAFNDGDGTLSIAKEADFHTAGKKMTLINTGNVAHHGAMTKFDNGAYAITVKDGSAAGTLPERVKIIDVSGKTLFASTVQTKGIHGNATNGSISLFGSSSGILVVEPTGNQQLIPHPADFGEAWFGSILEAKGAGKFLGYTAAKGVYIIDIVAKSVTPVLASADIMQVKVDYAGNSVVVLLHSGELRIYDLKTNTLKASGSVMGATAKDETQKPQLEATSRCVYITQPKSGELLVINTGNLSKISKVRVSATPYRLAILGFESSEGH